MPDFTERHHNGISENKKMAVRKKKVKEMAAQSRNRIMSGISSSRRAAQAQDK